MASKEKEKRGGRRSKKVVSDLSLNDGSVIVLDGELISSEVDELGSEEVNLDEISRLIKAKDDKLQALERRKKNSNIINIKPQASVEACG